MLSGHSFTRCSNPRRPPPHVKFLLATTDPQKLPVTVRRAGLPVSSQAPVAGADRRSAREDPTAEVWCPIPFAHAAGAGRHGSMRDAWACSTRRSVRRRQGARARGARDARSIDDNLVRLARWAALAGNDAPRCWRGGRRPRGATPTRVAAGAAAARAAPDRGAADGAECQRRARRRACAAGDAACRRRMCSSTTRSARRPARSVAGTGRPHRPGDDPVADAGVPAGRVRDVPSPPRDREASVRAATPGAQSVCHNGAPPPSRRRPTSPVSVRPAIGCANLRLPLPARLGTRSSASSPRRSVRELGAQLCARLGRGPDWQLILDPACANLLGKERAMALQSADRTARHPAAADHRRQPAHRDPHSRPGACAAAAAGGGDRDPNDPNVEAPAAGVQCPRQPDHGPAEG